MLGDEKFQLTTLSKGESVGNVTSVLSNAEFRFHHIAEQPIDANNFTTRIEQK